MSIFLIRMRLKTCDLPSFEMVTMMPSNHKVLDIGNKIRFKKIYFKKIIYSFQKKQKFYLFIAKYGPKKGILRFAYYILSYLQIPARGGGSGN